MTSKITETVTVTREVDPRIADLVRFVRFVDERLGLSASTKGVGHRPVSSIPDQELVALANAYWDREHGED